MSAESSSGDGVTLPLQELQGLAAALPMPARCDFWRRTLERAAQAESGEVRSRAWDGCLRSLIEEQATGLQTLLQGPAEASGSDGTGDQPISTEGDAPLDSFGMGVALLRRCETWIGTLSDAARRQALQQVLADQLVQVVGRLHHWLVIEKAEGKERGEWFWRSWELLQWRQAMAEPLPAWWPPVREQLVRLGALTWKTRSFDTDPISQEGQQAITRALTLLQALVPLHQPEPSWISQMEIQLLEQGIAALLNATLPSTKCLEVAIDWLCLLSPFSALKQKHYSAYSDRRAAAWREIGNGLQDMGVLELGEQALTAAQRQERRSGHRENSRHQPLIRTIHHLACTGETVISKCIAAMPHVVLLSEVNPLNRFGADFEPTNPLLTLERSHRRLSIPEIRDAFQRQIAQAVKICVDDGVDLVIRDHSHTDFCIGEKPAALTPIIDFLSEDYELLSVATVRHPLDSYLGLVASGWEKQFSPSSLEEYASRYHHFLDRYRSFRILRYEDFCIKPAAFMLDICSTLDLEYNAEFQERFGKIRLSGDSGRTSNKEISPRPRRETPAEVGDQIATSNAYAELLTRLGYS